MQPPPAPALPASCPLTGTRSSGASGRDPVRWRAVRVACGLGGHLRGRRRRRKGEYEPVSSDFTNTAHPACLWPPTPLPRAMYTACSQMWCPPGTLGATGHACLCRTRLSPAFLTRHRVGPDCEARDPQGHPESGRFSAGHTNLGAAQDRDGRRGSLLPSRAGWAETPQQRRRPGASRGPSV